MPSQFLRVSEYVAGPTVVNGHRVVMVTYRIGDRFACKIENGDVGLTISTVFRATKAEAVEAGLEEARVLLQPLSESADPPPRPVRTVTAILMWVGDEQVTIRPQELLTMSNEKRMSLILSGNLTFLDENTSVIPVGQGLELLRQDYEICENPLVI